MTECVECRRAFGTPLGPYRLTSPEEPPQHLSLEATGVFVFSQLCSAAWKAGCPISALHRATDEGSETVDMWHEPRFARAKIPSFACGLGKAKTASQSEDEAWQKLAMTWVHLLSAWLSASPYFSLQRG